MYHKNSSDTSNMNDILFTVSTLNDNRIMWGLTSLLFNMGSRFVMSDMGRIQEYIMSRPLVKLVVVFSMFFVATRDILLSVWFTLLYVVIFMGMLHERGKISVIPYDVRMHLLNKDSKIKSRHEYLYAKNVIEKFKKQSSHNN